MPSDLHKPQLWANVAKILRQLVSVTLTCDRRHSRSRFSVIPLTRHLNHLTAASSFNARAHSTWQVSYELLLNYAPLTGQYNNNAMLKGLQCFKDSQSMVAPVDFPKEGSTPSISPVLCVRDYLWC